MRSSVLAAAAGLLIFGCGPGGMSPTQRASVESAVMSQLDAWVRFLNERNVDSLATLYHQVPELTVVWSDGRRTRGWEEEAAMQREVIGSVGNFRYDALSPTVDVLSPEIAATTFRSSMDMGSGARRVVSGGQATLIWVRNPEDGAWRIRTEHTSRLVRP